MSTGAFVARRNGKVFVTGNSGFPKSLDVSKAIDKAAGAKREVVGFDPVAAARSAAIKTAAYGDYSGQTGDITAPATDAAKQWAGWGTALKPALEPITLARKPLIGTVATNVQAHGVGALNIDGCRISGESTARTNRAQSSYLSGSIGEKQAQGEKYRTGSDDGRWPANLIHDGSDEVTGLLGDPARFFYCAKASKRDRGEGNTHPTVKPVELMRWLLRLVTPPGGVTLDPFAGSGSTGVAAELEGFDFIGCELELPHLEIILSRLTLEHSDMLYATPFDPATRLCTGPSEPSGFDCLDDVVALMGEPTRLTRAMAVYPGMVYSTIVFSLDGAVTSGVSSTATDPESPDNVPN